MLTMNSPKTLNSLSPKLISALNSAVLKADSDKSVKAIVLTGAGRCFSAGADLIFLATQTLQTMIKDDPFLKWFEVLPKTLTPVIAAVHGFAFGGGFEVALMCDMVVTHAKTKHGFPEIKLGLFPGAGGT